MSIGGIDPIRSIETSQVVIEQIAIQLRRLANIGIGFAFSAQYIKVEVTHLQK